MHTQKEMDYVLNERDFADQAEFLRQLSIDHENSMEEMEYCDE